MLVKPGVGAPAASSQAWERQPIAGGGWGRRAKRRSPARSSIHLPGPFQGLLQDRRGGPGHLLEEFRAGLS